MTIRISSSIMRSRVAAAQTWFVSSAVHEPDAEPSRRYVLGTFGTAPTFDAAITLAAEQRADLDAELMEAVHDSRASRRQQRCEECHDPVPPGKAHWKIGEGPCMILPADQIDPDTAEGTYDPDIHTMEATA